MIRHAAFIDLVAGANRLTLTLPLRMLVAVEGTRAISSPRRRWPISMSGPTRYRNSKNSGVRPRASAAPACVLSMGKNPRRPPPNHEPSTTFDNSSIWDRSTAWSLPAVGLQRPAVSGCLTATMEGEQACCREEQRRRWLRHDSNSQGEANVRHNHLTIRTVEIGTLDAVYLPAEA